MEYILAVFAVRTETISFYNMLKRAGVNAIVVETPKSLQASCGISLKIIEKDYQRAKNILAVGNFHSFLRFYLIKGALGRRTILPLN